MKKLISIFLFSTQLYCYSPKSFSIGNHVCMNINSEAVTLELEDESLWHIQKEDFDVLESWPSSDPVEIKLNHEWFSLYPFIIRNLIDGQYVRANLKLAPPLGNDHALYFSEYGRTHSGAVLVHLNDCYAFKINPSDVHLLKNWLLGDNVMIGHNDQWYPSEYHFLLINTHNKSSARAKLI